MRPWFNKIVVNQCRTLLRSRRSTVTLEDANAITESADEDLVARIESAVESAAHFESREAPRAPAVEVDVWRAIPGKSSR